MYNIYLITNTINKKQYIGITKFTIQKRFKQHTKRGFILTESIKKYGEENFNVELIELVDTKEIAYELEKNILKYIILKFLMDTIYLMEEMEYLE